MKADELDLLIYRYLHGVLSEDERTSLREHLERNPEDSHRLVELAHDEVWFREHIGRLLNDAGEIREISALAGRGPAGTETTEVLRFQRVRHGLVWAAAAGVLLVAGVWWWSGREGRVSSVKGEVVARVVEKRSEVRSQKSDGRWTELKVGEEVRTGDQIETGNDGAVTLEWVNQPTTLQLDGNSTLETRHSTLSFLERGRLVAVVAKQPEGKSFVITTPHAEMRVVGTVFSATVTEKRTRLTVDKGEVEMKPVGGKSYEAVREGATAVARAGSDRLVFPWRVLKHIQPPGWHYAEQFGVATDGQLVWLYFPPKSKEENGILCGLDPDTGKEMKRIEMETGLVIGPQPKIVVEGSRLWGWEMGTGRLCAVDMSTGTKVRSLAMENAAIGCPFAIGDGVIWVWRDYSKQLLKVSLEDGKMLSVRNADKQLPWPVLGMTYFHGIAYLGPFRYPAMAAVQVEDGRVLWQTRLPIKAGFGEMAIEPKRGMWITSSLSGLYLLEADVEEDSER